MCARERAAVYSAVSWQLCLHQPTRFICGALMLISELTAAHPTIHVIMRSARESASMQLVPAEEAESKRAYDGACRDPLYAHAEDAPAW